MQTNESKPVIVIIGGPTGVGKTATAITLAESFNGEIINADSMQVYRQIDIGAAKPTPVERARIRHHLIDVVAPDEPFDAARFRHAANQAIATLNAAGKIPFIVGGTGLYIKALLYGLADAAPSDAAVRQRLKDELNRAGGAALYQRLSQCDPVSARRIHPNDTLRIIRALEVFEITGEPLSAHHHKHHFKHAFYRAVKIGLTLDRPLLYQRIDTRVDGMIQNGMIDEVQRLLANGIDPDTKPMQSIGYRHVVAYLQGNLYWEEMVALWRRDTRRYAKRQLTWFRADPEFQWFRPDELDDMRQLIADFLTHRG